MHNLRLNLCIPSAIYRLHAARSLLAVKPFEAGAPQDPANVVPARHKFPDPAESSSGDAHQWLAMPRVVHYCGLLSISYRIFSSWHNGCSDIPATEFWHSTAMNLCEPVPGHRDRQQETEQINNGPGCVTEIPEQLRGTAPRPRYRSALRRGDCRARGSD